MKLLPLVLAGAMLLLLQAQQLPEGNGKELVEKMCSSCHGIESVTAQRATKDGWETIVGYMASRGMIATDQEIKTMVEYLAKAFPAEQKK